jgi:hypothetical protein
MRQGVLAFGSILLLMSCTQAQFPERHSSPSIPTQSASATTRAVTDTLLALSQEWTDTWNQKNVERMTQLHGDIRNTLYGVGDNFTTVEWLLTELRQKNFWNVSWKVAMVEPRARVLGSDAGLVSFRLIGEEISASGKKPFVAAFTLVFQKLDGVWKIVHIQDSSRLDEPASP